MQIHFSKYHGTGNDFILIDNRNGVVGAQDIGLVKNLCDRRCGIGADGLILLENQSPYDFCMRYFNSDGREASMCGNGGRCIVAFASRLGIVGESSTFIAVDGEHRARVCRENGELHIKLKMGDVSGIEFGGDYCFLDTGSPHFVKFVPGFSNLDVCAEGKKIRFGERFANNQHSIWHDDCNETRN